VAGLLTLNASIALTDNARFGPSADLANIFSDHNFVRILLKKRNHPIGTACLTLGL
jgi:hypothetical protein|tara:strand:- start:1 stop:168 length:168 start_codon:yes stop_codon:yes gene_type:complete